jgi:hypothetical protein
MHSAQLVALHEDGQEQKVLEGAKEYIARVKSGKYNAIEAGKGYVSLGCAQWNLGHKDEALKSFREVENLEYKGKLSRWAIWARVHAAQLEDVLGMREEAIKDYKFVAAQPDEWGFYAFAKAGLAKPYAGPDSGRIPPP